MHIHSSSIKNIWSEKCDFFQRKLVFLTILLKIIDLKKSVFLKSSFHKNVHKIQATWNFSLILFSLETLGNVDFKNEKKIAIGWKPVSQNAFIPVLQQNPK